MRLSFLPFTYHWIIRNMIGDGKQVILDLGCGNGELMKDIHLDKKWDVIGVDLHKDSVQMAKKLNIYKSVLVADVKDLPYSIKKNKYDVVFSSQVLEHLKKSDGKKALRVWESLAKKKVVITTPSGFIEYEPIERKRGDDNPLQKHLSGWTASELIDRGYRVRGQGAKFIYGKNGLARLMPRLFPVFSILAYIFAPLVYYFPSIATYLIAYKKV